MKLCSKLLMFFDRNLCEQRQIWVSESILGRLDLEARPCLMVRWKAHGRLSIRVN